MPFTIVKDDITNLDVDAIVNSTDKHYHPWGVSAKKIHKAAGPELGKALKQLDKLELGTAAVTDGFNLKTKYLIHTNAPIWYKYENWAELLKQCYESCFNVAKVRNCESIALPIISIDTLGCQKEKALKIALDAIRNFLLENEIMIYLVVSDQRDLLINPKRYGDVNSYIYECLKKELEKEKLKNIGPIHEAVDLSTFHRQILARPKSKDIILIDKSSDEKEELRPMRGRSGSLEAGGREKFSARGMAPMGFGPEPRAFVKEPDQEEKPAKSKAKKNIPLPQEDIKELTPKLRDYVRDVSRYALDESFSEMLFRLIDERGLSDIEVYKKACVSKQIFSNIKSSTQYTPTNQIVLAFAIALKLNLEETEELLSKAGYALSPSRVFDIIVKYFIENEIYDIYEINITLFMYDQKLLGSK